MTAAVLYVRCLVLYMHRVNVSGQEACMLVPGSTLTYFNIDILPPSRMVPQPTLVLIHLPAA